MSEGATDRNVSVGAEPKPAMASIGDQYQGFRHVVGLGDGPERLSNITASLLSTVTARLRDVHADLLW